MQPSWKILALAAATGLAVPQLALADDVEAQLQQMQKRMSELENKLQATNDELETSKQKAEQQQELIEKAGLDESRGAASGLADFLNMVEVDGFVASSYNYNFNVLKSDDLPQAGNIPATAGAPSTVSGENGGILGITAPGHTNDNSFQLDQLWFGIGKTATMESPAGFRADIVYGAMADANREGTFYTTGTGTGSGADDHGTGDMPYVFQAYAEYLVPVGENGISIKGGRFATLIGAESLREDANFNITRGINWAMQPVNHTGLLVSGKCSSCGLDWALGVVNSYSDTMSDRDNEKGFLGGLKLTRETWAYATNIFYGGDTGDFAPWAYAGVPAGTPNGAGRNGDKIGVTDHILWWNPTDRFSAWANYDFYWVADTNNSASGNTGYTGTKVHTLALASRYGITDATGVAVRGEYQKWNLGSGGRSDLNFWALTATVDHTLTENMILKVEARYDIGNNEQGVDDFFMSGGEGPGVFNDNDQLMGIVQMMYKF